MTSQSSRPAGKSSPAGRLKGEYEVRPTWEADGRPGFIDLDADDVCPETHIAPKAGQGENSGQVKWLVVVDLHS